MLPPSYYLPAEWEPQTGIMLTWPHADTDWQPYLADITETYLQLATVIASREKLIIATPHTSEVLALLSKRLPNNSMANIRIYQCDSNDTWARDHGPITLLPVAGSGSDNILLDFRFNGWGEKFAAEKDNRITRELHRQNAFNGKLADNNDFVLEGGSIESDGKGTVMTTDFCLLSPHRNQPMSKTDIEKELKRRLCATRILWISHGHLIGDDTDGHIDTTVRFAPNDIILYTECDDNEDPQYNDFLLLKQQLRTIKTNTGKPYHLKSLPLPKPRYFDGERLPATYANFLVVNGAVIVPTYKQTAADKKAIETISSAFPDREIIGIDATNIIRQHGSIHCLTMQIY